MELSFLLIGSTLWSGRVVITQSFRLELLANSGVICLVCRGRFLIMLEFNLLQYPTDLYSQLKWSSIESSQSLILKSIYQLFKHFSTNLEHQFHFFHSIVRPLKKYIPNLVQYSSKRLFILRIRIVYIICQLLKFYWCYCLLVACNNEWI